MHLDKSGFQYGDTLVALTNSFSAAFQYAITTIVLLRLELQALQVSLILDALLLACLININL